MAIREGAKVIKTLPKQWRDGEIEMPSNIRNRLALMAHKNKTRGPGLQ